MSDLSTDTRQRLFPYSASMRNTRLNLVYRAARRDPIYKSVVLLGAMTEDQTAILKRQAIRGHMVIARQIGLPSPADEICPDHLTPTDHALTSLADWEDGQPSASALHTVEPPTVMLAIGALVSQVISMKWNVDAEHDHLGIPSPSVPLLTDEYDTPTHQVG